MPSDTQSRDTGEYPGVVVDDLLELRRDLSDDKLRQLHMQIRAVVTRGEYLLYTPQVMHPRTSSFLTSGLATQAATGLEEFDRILTLHRYNRFSNFMPTPEEVLSLIPEDALGEVKAYKTDIPTEEELRTIQRIPVSRDFQIANTTLYVAA